MMKKSILKTLLYMMMMCLPLLVHAQAVGDRLFHQGKQFQRTMTVASQNQAINKFSAAKVAYTTAADKSKCNSEIAVCKRNIASLNQKRTGSDKPPTGGTGKGTGGTGGKKGGKTGGYGNYVSDDVVPGLNISQDTIVFNAITASETAPTITVKAFPLPDTWTFSYPDTISWCKVERTDSTTLTFHLTAQNRTSTIPRSFEVNVKHGSEAKNITVLQKGKPVELSIEKNQVMFGKDGFPVGGSGKIGKGLNRLKNLGKTLFSDKTGVTIKVYSESNHYYRQNEDGALANWFVVEPWPDWLVVVRSERDTENKCHAVYIEARPNTSGKQRSANLIIRSQDEEAIVNIVQQP